MLVIPLASGSNGNCVYVESDGTRILVDAGISGVCAQRRLGQYGRKIETIDAVLISHDHADHVRCAGIYHRKFKLPLYVTAPTLRAADAYCPLGKLKDVMFFQAGASLRVGGLTIQTIPTPHDACDGVAFVIDDGRRRLGVLTDLGHPFAALGGVMDTLDAVVLESNYDEQMLQSGPYPAFLKRRIRGAGGHLSNTEAGALLARCLGGRLAWACLAHLSEHNNTPARALDTARGMVGQALPISVASRYGPIGPLEI